MNAQTDPITASTKALQSQVASDMLRDYKEWRHAVIDDGSPEALRKLIEFQARITAAEIKTQTDPHAGLAVFNISIGGHGIEATVQAAPVIHAQPATLHTLPNTPDDELLLEAAVKAAPPQPTAPLVDAMLAALEGDLDLAYVQTTPDDGDLPLGGDLTGFSGVPSQWELP